MIIVFKSQLLIDLYDKKKTNNKLFRSNPHLISKFQSVIFKMKVSDHVNQLKQYPGLHYERLRGNMNGYCSIRLDKKYRLIFREVYSEIKMDLISYLEIIEISNHYS